MRICILTTSYPRTPGDVAGSFVAEQVEHLRSAGVEVAVVSPASFRHFGIAYGGGIVQNLRARPWLAFALPLFFIGFARGARRAARGADLVHAHWIPSGLVAVATGKPFVLQVWGTDVELARRVAWLARPLFLRAKLVLAASRFLADAARSLGAREVRVLPSGVEIPDEVGEPEQPPHVLFAGRLSEEKGILDFLAATNELPRVIVGDGPLRHLVTEAVGFVPHDRLGSYYEAAAVVCVPSHREGYGVVVREAMAFGRPVVATAVGGVVEVVEDGETGLLVPPGDPVALRGAIVRLLGDRELSRRLGSAARDRTERELRFDTTTAALISIYEEALS